MNRIFTEAFRILPAVFFFFFAFNLINFTTELTVKREHVQGASLLLIIIASAIVAKVLLVIDHLRVISLFHKKPLIYDILWKTFLYSTVALFVRFLTLLYPFSTLPSFHIDYAAFTATVDWPRFWGVQIWYIILFFIFVSARDLTKAIGRDKVKRILFGPRSDRH